MARPRPLAPTIVIAALLALTATAVPAAAASMHSVGATLGTTGSRTHRAYHLKITLDGSTALNEVVTSRACPVECTTIALSPGRTPIKALALRAYATPDVILGLYSGGAHCCFVDQVYRLNEQTGKFVKIEHDFLDAGAAIKDLDGDRNYEFVSGDARLSPAPLQIWTVAHNRFTDVTRRYPNRIAADAARWLNAFRSHTRNGRGLIAAWAADEYLLGHGALVRSQLASALKAGHLGVPAFFGGPKPAKYIGELQTLLRKLGYRR
jgi:hypothetical protein